MTKTARFLIPLAVLLFAFSAVAQERAKYRLEVFAGVNVPQDKNFEMSFPQTATPMKATHEWSPGVRGGVRLGAEAWRHWGQEFSYSYGTNATKIVNHSNGASFGFTPQNHEFSYNLIWYPSDARKKAVPYLTTGLGGSFYRLQQSTINEALDPNQAGLGKLRNESLFTFNAGGGVRFRVNDVYGFRIDARDYFSSPPRFGLPEKSNDPNAIVFPVSGIFQRLEVSIAFVYYFK